MNWYIVFAIYIAVINLTGFIIMGVDKRKAIAHKYRIPENTLFLIAIIGGSLGGLLGMQFFRHKTKHLKFKIGFPAIFLVHIGVLLYLLVK